jgi:hypothetical protein
MTGMDADHFGILNACIQGKRSVDDRTLASAAVLQERLTRLKQSQRLCAEISFSPQLEQLSHLAAAAPV